MSQIMKTFLGLFLIMFMTVTSVGILSGFLSVISAQNQYAQIVNELEDSNYDSDVIDECFNNVNRKNQKLHLTLYLSDNTIRNVDGKGQVEDGLEIEKAYVELKFSYSVNFFGINEEHNFTGYAM